MTRRYSKNPVWCWACDTCEREFPIYERSQGLLPTYEQMRVAGWFIAEKFGDKCPECREKEGGNDGE